MPDVSRAQTSRRLWLVLAVVSSIAWATAGCLVPVAPAGQPAPTAGGTSAPASATSTADPAPATTPASTAAPADAHYQASVSVHNGCPDKVRIFRGRVSGSSTGSGTYGWHSSNSTTSYHLSGDDELCIVADNDRDILSCTKPQTGSRLEVTSSCSGFTGR